MSISLVPTFITDTAEHWRPKGEIVTVRRRDIEFESGQGIRVVEGKEIRQYPDPRKPTPRWLMDACEHDGPVLWTHPVGKRFIPSVKPKITCLHIVSSVQVKDWRGLPAKLVTCRDDVVFYVRCKNLAYHIEPVGRPLTDPPVVAMHGRGEELWSAQAGEEVWW